jgi:hypothetical protein
MDLTDVTYAQAYADMAEFALNRMLANFQHDPNHAEIREAIREALQEIGYVNDVIEAYAA